MSRMESKAGKNKDEEEEEEQQQQQQKEEQQQQQQESKVSFLLYNLKTFLQAKICLPFHLKY